MFIIYEKNAAVCGLYVPNDRPWQIEGFSSEDSIAYTIRFISDELDVELLSSLDYYDLIEFSDDWNTTEDEAVQALYCEILAAATKDVARMVRNKEELCLDLRKIVEKEVEFFIKFWQTIYQDEEDGGV